MIEALLIGGPRDGDRVTIDADINSRGRLTTKRFIIEPRPLRKLTEPGIHGDVIETVEYVQIVFSGERRHHYLWVHAGMTSDEAIEHLLTNYGRPLK